MDDSAGDRSGETRSRRKAAESNDGEDDGKTDRMTKLWNIIEYDRRWQASKPGEECDGRTWKGDEVCGIVG